MKLNVLLLALLFFGCNDTQQKKVLGPFQIASFNIDDETEHYVEPALYFELRGVLGNNIESSIQLEGSSENLTGFFFNHENGEDISIAGHWKNSMLYLEEYNSEVEDSITGIFEGVFDTTTMAYNGHWKNQSNDFTVPFKYGQSVYGQTENEEIKWTPDEEKAIKKIRKAYLKLSTLGCHDDFFQIVLGNINGDMFLDAWVRIDCAPEDAGTANRWDLTNLVIVSTPEGDYKIIEEPNNINKNGDFQAVAWGVEYIELDGTLVYKFYDYRGDEALCCPSREWKARFTYKDGRLVKLK